jgi:hypothetical protein
VELEGSTQGAVQVELEGSTHGAVQVELEGSTHGAVCRAAHRVFAKQKLTKAADLWVGGSHRDTNVGHCAGGSHFDADSVLCGREVCPQGL